MVKPARPVPGRMARRLPGIPFQPGDRSGKVWGARAAAGGLHGGVPAAAADGANVILGHTSGVVLNDAAHTTSLTATAALGTPTPLVKIIGSGATPPSAPPNGPDLEGALQVFSKP